MEDNKLMKVAAAGFIGLVVFPAVVGAGCKLIGCVANGVNSLAFKRKIKKGLKEGSIVEIDGNYYEVDMDAVEEA